jgi:hypothetical protein
VDRGPGEASATQVQIVTLGAKPSGTSAGDTLRIKEGPNAGDYKILSTERRVLFLDRDLPVPQADTSEEPKPVQAEVLSPEGKMRGAGAVPMQPNAAMRPGLKFARAPAGVQTNDYVRVIDADGTDVWHQVKGLRGDVALLDHAFVGAAEGQAPTSVFVKKSTLPPYAMTATIIGMMFGIFITLMEVFGSKKIRPYLPSITGLGIAFVVNCFDSLAMMIGAIIAYVLAKTVPKIEERYNVATSSGIIAGSSIAGLALIILHLVGLVSLG